MPPTEFELSFPASDRVQILVVDGSATEIGFIHSYATHCAPGVNSVDLPLLLNVQTSSAAHLASYSVGQGVLSTG